MKVALSTILLFGLCALAEAQCPDIWVADASCTAATNCDPPFTDCVSSTAFVSTVDVDCQVKAELDCGGGACYCVACVQLVDAAGNQPCIVHTGCGGSNCTASFQCHLTAGVTYKLVVCKRTICDNVDCSMCGLGCTARGHIGPL